MTINDYQPDLLGDVAAEMSAARAVQDVRLAVAAVEPYWGYLSQASSPVEFTHRLALLTNPLQESVAGVVTDPAEAVEEVQRTLSSRFAALHRDREVAEQDEALRSAVAASVEAGLKTADRPASVSDHEAVPDWDTSEHHDLCGVCDWPVSKGKDGQWTHDAKNPVQWSDKRKSASKTAALPSVGDMIDGPSGWLDNDEIGKVKVLSVDGPVGPRDAYRVMVDAQDGSGPFEMTMFKDGSKTAGWDHYRKCDFCDKDIRKEPDGTYVHTETGKAEGPAQGKGVAHKARPQSPPSWEMQMSTSRHTGSWLDAARTVLNKGFRAVHPETGAITDTVWAGDEVSPRTEGVLLDAFTASMLVQVHDALSPANAAKFAAMPLMKAVDVGWALTKGKGAAKTATEDPDFDQKMYEWGYSHGVEDAASGRDLPDLWNENEKGMTPVDWRTAEKPFPTGYRDGLEGRPPKKTSAKTGGYRVKKFEGGSGSKWGVWDEEQDSWHDGDHDDAYYAAGIPYWKHEDKAKAAIERLNKSSAKTADTSIPTASDQPSLVLEGVRIRLDEKNYIGWMSDWNAPYEYGWLDKGWVEAVDHQSGGLGGLTYRLTSAGKAKTTTAVEALLQKGAPFAGYKDFADCVSKNSDKDDPEAYCGSIKHKVEDKESSKTAAEVSLHWKQVIDAGISRDDLIAAVPAHQMNSALAYWDQHKTSAKSDVCPQCGSHMSDVTVTGNTLKAKCSTCGWSGTKKKAGAVDSTCYNCSPAGSGKDWNGRTCQDCGGTGIDSTPYGTGGDHCPYCGADWKQPHREDCPRARYASKTSARTGPTIDDPHGYEYTPAPDWVQHACIMRFEGGGPTGVHPDKPGWYLHGIGNFWDGPSEVKDNGDHSLSYTNPYTGETDRFDERGYWDRGGTYTRRTYSLAGLEDATEEEWLEAEAAFFKHPTPPNPAGGAYSQQLRDMNAEEDVERQGERAQERRHEQYWDAHPEEHERHLQQNRSMGAVADLLNPDLGPERGRSEYDLLNRTGEMDWHFEDLLAGGHRLEVPEYLRAKSTLPNTTSTGGPPYLTIDPTHVHTIAPTFTGLSHTSVNTDAYGTERYQSQPTSTGTHWDDAWDAGKAPQEMLDQGRAGYEGKEHPFKDRLTTVRQSALRLLGQDGIEDSGDISSPTPEETSPQPSKSQPLTTRPRVHPQDHREPSVANPPTPPGTNHPADPATMVTAPGVPVDQMGSFDAFPSGMGMGTSMGFDPMVPTVDQMVAAKVGALAQRVRLDNPSLTEDEARHLAAQTVARFPEMVKQEEG